MKGRGHAAVMARDGRGACLGRRDQQTGVEEEEEEEDDEEGLLPVVTASPRSAHHRTPTCSH